MLYQPQKPIADEAPFYVEVTFALLRRFAAMFIGGAGVYAVLYVSFVRPYEANPEHNWYAYAMCCCLVGLVLMLVDQYNFENGLGKWKDL